MTSLNYIDVAVIAIAVLGLLIGFLRGFIAQIISISGFVLAYIVAFCFYKNVSPVLRSALPVPAYESYQQYEFIVKGLNLDTYVFNAVSFALLFFGTKLGISLIGKTLHIIAKMPGLNAINRWTGALLGLVEALLIVVIAVNVLTITPSDMLQRELAGSVIAPYCINEFPQLAGKLQELWKQNPAV
ncbi:CvpA family protein [Paenibacillus hexagrammi]|uniref:CvpA family protein n=1 Tax=Paenibacillus hexagrammi TaxID=2908839 RepID=A0ABY3SMN1_9BACL|nr:CvpA family protein [Paenibacillus sp. YPD9-1]UJF34461.1 CvpA family protein [Paenibacillus sp. YPD9-1]